MIGALPLGHRLNKRNIVKGMCFSWPKELDHSWHRFLSCSIARMVWSCMIFERRSLIRVILSSFNCGFAHIENNGEMHIIQINFKFLRYWVKRASFVAIDNIREATKRANCHHNCQLNWHGGWD